MSDPIRASAAPAAALPKETARAIVATEHMLGRQRAFALATVVVPALGFAGGVAWIAVEGLASGYLLLWACMHALNVAGISLGFHRLATHRSFDCGSRTRRVPLIMGSMAGQGPVIHWASNHRRHHHTCDDEGDVHSPWCDEDGRHFESRLSGFWHSHVAWLFRSRPTNPVRYTVDLIRDNDTMFVNRHYLKWMALGIVLPGAIAAAFAHTWGSFLLGCLVGGLMRMFVAQHITWFINSLTHLFGRRPYATADRSTNLAWLAVVSGGESWHNNHHAFPYSARLGLEWWQPDPGWWMLRSLRATRLAWDIKLPSEEARAAKLRA